MATSSAPKKDLSLAETRAELSRHFSSYQGDDYTDGWNKLWEQGSFLPWDRGRPSPALEDTLVSHRDIVGSAVVDGRRKKALVPGCGRGVDVLLLESYGYDAVGLEVSQKAIQACFEYAEQHASLYPVKDEEVGKGSRKFVKGDFYEDNFLKDARLAPGQKFDLIYDYTFFCAMQPSMRPAWAKRMSDLLADSAIANLICLEFPTDKDPSSGGPPWASPSKAYIEHLSHPGEDIPYGDDGHVKYNPVAPSGPGALERVGWWHPSDTHAAGKDEAGTVKDFISVWRHR
jgi:SAM-dependent methyltransferase